MPPVTSADAQRANAAALAEAARNLSLVLVAGEHGTRDAMHDVGIEFVNEVRRLLSTPGRGRTYTLSNPRRTHRASAPGDPPAVDFGHLRASYRYTVGRDPSGWYTLVGTDLDKAPKLEFGTVHMAARPHFRPALDNVSRSITLTIAERIAKEQRKRVRDLRGRFLPGGRIPGLGG